MFKLLKGESKLIISNFIVIYHMLGIYIISKYYLFFYLKTQDKFVIQKIKRLTNLNKLIVLVCLRFIPLLLKIILHWWNVRNTSYSCWAVTSSALSWYSSFNIRFNFICIIWLLVQALIQFIHLFLNIFNKQDSVVLKSNLNIKNKLFIYFKFSLK